MSECCGMPRDQDGRCVHRPGHPVDFDRELVLHPDGRVEVIGPDGLGRDVGRIRPPLTFRSELVEPAQVVDFGVGGAYLDAGARQLRVTHLPDPRPLAAGDRQLRMSPPTGPHFDPYPDGPGRLT